MQPLTEEELREQKSHRILEFKVSVSKWILASVFILILSAYAVRFGRNGLSLQPDAWGQFGDFVGGILNPLIAFFAFYWLATSVLLQKAELADTRKALTASQKAQQLQADTSLLAARIQHLNIKLQSVAMRLNLTRQQYGELLHFQGVNGPSRIYFDESGTPSSPQEVIGKLRAGMLKLIDQENELINEIEKLSQEFLDTKEEKLNVGTIAE